MTGELSAKDRGTLELGGLVIRSETEGQRGRATALGVVQAPVEAVWDAVTDYDGYVEFMPQVVESRVDRVEDGAVTVTNVLKILVKRIRYTIRLELDRARHRVEWRQLEGDLKANEGSWALEPFGDGRTLATYSVRIEVGFLVPQGVVDRLTRGSFGQLFQAIRDRATAS